MVGKLLVTVVSGPDEPEKVLWGLRMALNTFIHPYGEQLLDDVEVLLFAEGVGIVDPNAPNVEEYRERLLHLEQAGVKVVACISIAENIGLVEEYEALDIELVHASAYVAQKVSEGYTIMTF